MNALDKTFYSKEERMQWLINAAERHAVRVCTRIMTIEAGLPGQPRTAELRKQRGIAYARVASLKKLAFYRYNMDV